jgi:hypothetical protein
MMLMQMNKMTYRLTDEIFMTNFYHVILQLRARGSILRSSPFITPFSIIRPLSFSFFFHISISNNYFADRPREQISKTSGNLQFQKERKSYIKNIFKITGSQNSMPHVLRFRVRHSSLTVPCLPDGHPPGRPCPSHPRVY